MNDAVSDADAQDEQLLAMCRLLNEHEVRYLICGGYACILHGNLRMTHSGVVIRGSFTSSKYTGSPTCRSRRPRRKSRVDSTVGRPEESRIPVGISNSRPRR